MPFLADPRLRLPAHRLERWVDRPVRHTFPRLEATLIAAARMSGPGRALEEGERRILFEVFDDSLALEPIRVVEARWLNAPTVLGNTIRIRPGYAFSGWHSSTLVHEAMHLWQFQHHGTGYITDSAWHNLRSLLRTGRRTLAYLNYQLAPDSRLADFTAEQQATIIADYYELTHFFPAGGQGPLSAEKTVASATRQLAERGPRPPVGMPAWAVARRGDLPIYQRLLDEVRARRATTT